MCLTRMGLESAIIEQTGSINTDLFNILCSCAGSVRFLDKSGVPTFGLAMYPLDAIEVHHGKVPPPLHTLTVLDLSDHKFLLLIRDVLKKRQNQPDPFSPYFETLSNALSRIISPPTHSI